MTNKVSYMCHFERLKGGRGDFFIHEMLNKYFTNKVFFSITFFFFFSNFLKRERFFYPFRKFEKKKF